MTFGPTLAPVDLETLVMPEGTDVSELGRILFTSCTTLLEGGTSLVRRSEAMLRTFEEDIEGLQVVARARGLLERAVEVVASAECEKVHRLARQAEVLAAVFLDIWDVFTEVRGEYHLIVLETLEEELEDDGLEEEDCDVCGEQGFDGYDDSDLTEQEEVAVSVMEILLSHADAIAAAAAPETPQAGLSSLAPCFSPARTAAQPPPALVQPEPQTSSLKPLAVGALTVAAVFAGAVLVGMALGDDESEEKSTATSTTTGTAATTVNNNIYNNNIYSSTQVIHTVNERQVQDKARVAEIARQRKKAAEHRSRARGGHRAKNEAAERPTPTQRSDVPRPRRSERAHRSADVEVVVDIETKKERYRESVKRGGRGGQAPRAQSVHVKVEVKK